MKNVKLNDITYEGINKVQLPTADGGTASFKDEDEIVEPVLKTGVVITPTTQPQNISVPDGFDGFDEFAVEAVTAAIDPNIIARNIKRNVTILNVHGELDAGTPPVLDTPEPVVPTTEDIPVKPREGFDGIAELIVKGVTAAIDANILEENIKEGITILNVHGAYKGEPPAPKTPTIQVAQDGLITVSGDGIVTTTHQLSEADDPDFSKANIAKDVTIFGKVGTHEGGGGSSVPFSDVTFVSEGVRRVNCVYTDGGTTNTGGYLKMTIPTSGVHRYILFKTRAAVTGQGSTGNAGNGCIIIEVDCDNLTAHGEATKKNSFFGTSAFAIDTYVTVVSGMLTIKGNSNAFYAFDDDANHVAQFNVFEYTGNYVL